MIALPGKAEGSRTKALVELLDLYPTLADVCGLPLPPGIEGTSLLPVLKDPSRGVKQAALTQHPRPAYYNREPARTPAAMGYSIRTDRFRFTQWRDWKLGVTLASELYDYSSDPDETKNVAGEAAYASAVKESAAIVACIHPLTRPR
jgi:iduronate 2-sulfatase